MRTSEIMRHLQTFGSLLLEQRAQPGPVTTYTVTDHDTRNAAQVEALDGVKGTDSPAVATLEMLARRVDALEAAFKDHCKHG